MVEAPKTWQEKRKSYFAIAVICFLAGTFFFINVVNEIYIIKPDDLTTIEKLVISKKPIFKKSGGKNKKKWIEFKCEDNYSTFEIASFDYRCVVDSEILNEIKPGDTISIQVLNSEMKYFDAETVCEIHSLIKNDKEYLNMECRNKADNSDGKRGCIMLLAISLMCFIVYAFENKPTFFDDVNPNFLIVIISVVLFIALCSIE